jgi:hypothetical protein
MEHTGFRIIFKAGTWAKKIAGKKMPGLDLERALVDFLLVKNIAKNPSGDCCTLLPSVNSYSEANTSASALVRVESTSTEVLSSFASNTLTVTKPAGAKINSLSWRILPADVQATTDGTVTNWVRIVLTGTTGNTGITDLNLPIVQKVALPAAGALSLSNAGTYDVDNAPLVDVVGATAGTLTLRVSGLSAVPAQGIQLLLSNIY